MARLRRFSVAFVFWLVLVTDVTGELWRPNLNPAPQIRKTYCTADLKKIGRKKILEHTRTCAYLCFLEFSPKLYPADSQNTL